MPNSTGDKNIINPDLDDLLTLPVAAKISGLSHDHLRRLAERGDLWAKKVGRDWMTTEIAVGEYLALNRRPGRKKRT